MANNNNNTEQKWHLGKEIPITLVFLICVQTAGGVWWAATLTNKLDNLTTQINDLKSEKYTKGEAVKDQSLINLRIENIERRVELLEQKRK